MSLRAVALAAFLLALGAPAWADEPPTVPVVTPSPAATQSPAPTPPPPCAWAGFLAGNGIGEVGLEAGYRVGPHLAIGLHGGKIIGSGIPGGFGLAPLLRLSLEPNGGPFVTVGATWFRFNSDATTTISGQGLLAGVGYEWRPVPAFALVGGAGLAYVPTTSIDRAGTASEAPGGLKPNIELGVRWYAF